MRVQPERPSVERAGIGVDADHRAYPVQVDLRLGRWATDDPAILTACRLVHWHQAQRAFLRVAAARIATSPLCTALGREDQGLDLAVKKVFVDGDFWRFEV